MAILHYFRERLGQTERMQSQQIVAVQELGPPVYALAVAAGHRQVSIELGRKIVIPARPVELANVISTGEFEDRCSQLKGLFEKYYWNILVRIWFTASFIVALVAPWPAVVMARNAILQHNYDAIDLAEATNQPVYIRSGDYTLASIATFGIIIGIFSLAWGPYYFYRHTGVQHIKRLLKSFPNPESEWQVRYVKNFRGTADIAIRVPLQALFGGGEVPYGFGVPTGGWLPEYKKDVC